MELSTVSNKRPIHEDSSEEEPTSPLPSKRTAPGSPTSGQNGTVMPKGTGRGDLSKISTFCPNAPKLERGAGQVDKSPSQVPISQQIQLRGPRVLLEVAEIVEQWIDIPSQSHMAQLKQQLKTKLSKKTRGLVA